jgi:hypothetical protein
MCDPHYKFYIKYTAALSERMNGTNGNSNYFKCFLQASLQ